jgi:predicted site-specific integrase-resolvase
MLSRTNYSRGLMMPSTNGHGPKRAILYARVSSDDQVRGYSLDQQIRALREWVAREGYEVLEVVRDEGWSGAYLERPGLDRVRDHVEAGGVGVVVAQDADRISRDPAHRAFLDDEFERFGTRLVALDDWDDDTHEEGELLEHLKGWVSKAESASQYPSGAAGEARRLGAARRSGTCAPPRTRAQRAGRALIPAPEAPAAARGSRPARSRARWLLCDTTQARRTPPPTPHPQRSGRVLW